MPFGREKLDAKVEFVRLATQVDSPTSFSELCRRFGISRSQGYVVLSRFLAEGKEGLVDRSRRPWSSPTKTCSEIEAMVLEMRDQTHWGARKIAHRLRTLGVAHAPPRTTVQNILNRNGRVSPEESAKHTAWTRFEHPFPNDLWQMDFKGWFMAGQERCNPLTILDDHSRFSLGLRACSDQTTGTVQTALTNVFERYGLPWRMTMDNGSPWGDDGQSKLTKLVMWLIRLGIKVSHSRPFHPQTQGKDERFHRTLDDELLRSETSWLLRRGSTSFAIATTSNALMRACRCARRRNSIPRAQGRCRPSCCLSNTRAETRLERSMLLGRSLTAGTPFVSAELAPVFA